MFTLVFVFATGCASTNSYIANRGRDAADMLTATMGSGFGGFKVKAGPLQGGLLTEGICVNFYGEYTCDTQTKGLRGGEWLTEDSPKREFAGWETNFDYQYFIYGMEFFRGGEEGFVRGKSRAGFTFVMLSFPVPEDLFYKNRKDKDPNHIPARFSPLPYFFDVEVALGFGYIFHLGFNLAEFCDFLLGLTTIDFLDDDMGAALENKVL